jgi:AraC-like DNA-binding protein
MLDRALGKPDFGNAPQRMAALVGLPALAAEFGVDFARILEGFPLQRAAFDSDENRIPYGLICQVLEKAAALTGCPHLGLLLGSRFDHRCMGIAGQWMQNAPTLEAALTGFIALQSTATRGATAYLHRVGEYCVLGYGAYDRSALGCMQVYATVIPLAVNFIRSLTGGKARIEEILFTFRKPVDVRPYEAFFGVPVRFGQPQTGIVMAQGSLGLAIPVARAVDFAELQSRASAMMPPSDAVWTDRVKRLLRRSLLRGDVSGPDVAAELGINPRALRRNLESEGTSFKDVLAEVRCNAAQELLAVTDLGAGDIAEALCYANQPAFNHAFRRWSGVTPLQWRMAWRSAE